MSAIDKIPPSSLKAEQSTLGSMMIELDAALRAMEILQASDFYRPAHQDVFEAIVALVTRDEPTDLIMTQEELRKRGKLDDIGGTEYLMALVDTVPTAANIEHYAKIVLGKSKQRRVISACTEVAGAVWSDEECDAVDVLVDKALSLSPQTDKCEVTIVEATNKAWDKIVSYQSGNRKMGISWGIQRLDRLSYGVSDIDYVLIGGRPSEGKTVLLIQLALNAAQAGIPVQFFSLEMTEEQICERMIFTLSRVDAGPVKAGEPMSGDDWNRAADVSSVLYNLPIYFPKEDTLAGITAKARRAALQKKAGLVIVDFLQLVKTNRRFSNRNEEMTVISSGMKAITRAINAPVVAATQLSRGNKTEKREPCMHDLREGGNQEGDVDKLILIHNPPPVDDIDDDLRSVPRMAKLIFAKHRGGRTGAITTLFNPGCTRFEDCEGRYEERSECKTDSVKPNWWA